MVVRMEEGCIEDGGDAGAGIGEVVAAEIPALDLGWLVIDGIQLETGSFGIGRKGDRYEVAGIAVWGLDAEEGGAIGIVAADHISVENGDDGGMGDGGVGGEPAGAQQAAFFSAMPDEESRAAAGLLVECPGDGEEGDADAGIVVGAIEYGIGAGDMADTVVIVVTAIEDVFFAENGVCAGLDADNVDGGVVEVFNTEVDMDSGAGGFDPTQGGRVEKKDGCAFGDLCGWVAFERVGTVIKIGGVEGPTGFDEAVGDKDDGDGAFGEEGCSITTSVKAGIAAKGEGNVEVNAFGRGKEGDSFAFYICVGSVGFVDE